MFKKKHTHISSMFDDRLHGGGLSDQEDSLTPDNNSLRKYVKCEFGSKLKYPGKLIAIEGIDGSGKSTQVKLLKEALPEAIFFCQPTHSETGMVAREYMMNNDIDILKNKKELLHLIFMDRFRLYYGQDGIQHYLSEGKTVITDRSQFSTIAYLAYNEPEFIHEVAKFHVSFKLPDLVIYVDTPASVANERVCSRQEKTNFYENEIKLSEIESYFKWLSEAYEFEVVSGESSPEDIHQVIKQLVINKEAKDV